MSWFTGVVDKVRDAFNIYFNSAEKCNFLRISPDIFVDEIFFYLLIDDLLALRKVWVAVSNIIHALIFLLSRPAKECTS
jgi:hypothetical protein